MRGRSGFTLIELICVVAIVALLFTLAALRMDHLIPKYKLRGAAREIGAILKQARTRAASAGQDVYVQIEVSEGRYGIVAPFPKLNNDGTPKDPPELEYQEVFRRELPGDFGKRVEFVNVILGRDQKIENGRALIRLSPFGASSHVIVNLRLDDAPMAVKMNGLTGVLSFTEEFREADELVEDHGE
ncbi:MAG: prepilin-type N-terminal cleavage/methylation domain-containing protein [Planctomycetes bacterium]|nr:prepilin-type N-terminal cleavage/methylation domain-containing protein [Planctomycetota bacterium]